MYLYYTPQTQLCLLSYGAHAISDNTTPFLLTSRLWPSCHSVVGRSRHGWGFLPRTKWYPSDPTPHRTSCLAWLLGVCCIHEFDNVIRLVCVAAGNHLEVSPTKICSSSASSVQMCPLRCSLFECMRVLLPTRQQVRALWQNCKGMEPKGAKTCAVAMSFLIRKLDSFSEPTFFSRTIFSGYHCFIYRNIGVLCGMLLSLGGVNKTFVIWLELSSVIVRDHFVSVSIFCVRVFL